MTSHDWKNIQSKLSAHGFAPGPIDGAPGPRTHAAVRAFQKKNRLKPDGIVGNKTYRALFGTSPAGSISVMKAAEMVATAYDLSPHGATDADTVLRDVHGRRVTRRCTIKGIEAYLLDNDCLLIPGSNSLADYLRFNLRVWSVGKKRLRFRAEAQKQKVDKRTKLGFSRTRWHQGFFRHANSIRTWIEDNATDPPKMIIGHSLGAAAAQILSKTWGAPAIGFAAPRPRKSRGAIVLDELSLSICRDDDIVCFLPSSFHRMGQTRTLIHANPKGVLNHNMDAYIDALNHRAPNLDIPSVWNP